MNKKYQKKSILVIRITGMGDIVMSSPIASGLKESNPNLEITWVVHPRFKTLLEGHPDVDNIITFDTDRWEELWRKKQLFALYREAKAIQQILQKQNFERAIDLQGNTVTGMIAKLSGATHRISLGPEGINSLFMTKTISRNLGDQTQMGSEYRYLVNQLGCSDNNWKMFVPQTETAKKHAKIRLDETLGNSPYAIVAPFANYEQKNWFEDYWEQVILRIRGRYQLRTIIMGGDNGIEAGNKIARLTGAINLSGKISIEESAAIIQGASLLIGVDTGITHMSHAMKIPTISLFGATHPYAYVESEVGKVLYLDRFCSPCKKHPTCNKKYQCMREITPDQVLTAIKPLMKKANATATPN